MSKFGYLAIAGMCAATIALAGCGGAQQATSSSAEQSTSTAATESTAIDGGWSFAPLDEIHLSSDLGNIFVKAAKGTGAEGYSPALVLATQVVAGTNYAFLCDSGDQSWHIVAVYNDLQGNASIISDEEIDIANVKIADAEKPGGDEDMVGAWEVVNPEEPGVVSEAAMLAFEKASKTYTGMNFDILAVLGTQVVAGTNYKVLCAGAQVTADPETEPSLYVVDVYEDLEGASEITDVSYFNLLGYINQ